MEANQRILFCPCFCRKFLYPIYYFHSQQVKFPLYKGNSIYVIDYNSKPSSGCTQKGL